MSYSKLTDKYLPVPSHSGKRTQQIRHIVIHHNAGINSIESLHEFFLSGSRQVSANYGIGNDGRIACYVDEENRAWTTGGDDPDQMAITFEVSNCEVGGKWRISDEAMKSVILLVADIIQRYQITGIIYTGDKNGILLKHCYYSATACPGEYLSSKFGYIAGEAKKILESKQEKSNILYKVQIGAFKEQRNANTTLSSAKANGFNAFIANENGLYKVQIGAFSNVDNAKKLAEKAKKSGFKVYITNLNETQPKVLKPIATVAKEVIRGDWGNGLHRYDKLTKAGYNYDEVMKEVNKQIYK